MPSWLFERIVIEKALPSRNDFDDKAKPAALFDSDHIDAKKQFFRQKTSLFYSSARNFGQPRITPQHLAKGWQGSWARKQFSKSEVGP